ncbi:MAG TPA: transporter substrate-binding domain-containing protein [Micromonosporaceae bacterium]|nr:transporter substrate-binding domain-containing protein [Micromonosporaceae bacterium]
MAGAAVKLTNWGAGPTVEDYLAASGLANKSELRVGTYAHIPLLAYSEKEKPTRLADYEGFEIEIIRSLSAYLGFGEESVRLVPTTADERENDLNSGRVDIVVATFVMTPEREKALGFAGPYQVTKSEVLVRSDEARDHMTFSDLRDLGPKKVCTTHNSVSDIALRDHAVENVDKKRGSECVKGLLDGKYKAFTLSDLILEGYRSAHPKDLKRVDLVFEQTYGFGIAVAKKDEKLRQVIGNFLVNSYERGESGAWQRAWDKTLSSVFGDRTQPKPNEFIKLRDYRDRIRPPGLGAMSYRIPVVTSLAPDRGRRRRR